MIAKSPINLKKKKELVQLKVIYLINGSRVPTVKSTDKI